MALSATFMKAILAMDSYNRGYNQGINLSSGATTVGSQLGLATVIQQSDFLDGTAGVNIGFYAIAYSYAGETVVSYRGTDQFLAGKTYDGFDIGGDIPNSYGVGAGAADTPQSRMAFLFYRAVAGVDPYTANISLTGHSLGGGLAGLVAAVYHKSGLLLDNMAFQDAASSTAYTKTDNNSPYGQIPVYNADFYTTIDGSTALKNPIFFGAAYSIAGQVLANGFVPSSTANQNLIPPQSLDLYAGGGLNGIDAFDLHNVATLVIRMYADEPSQSGNHSWQASAQYFWPVMYDNNFAKAIGISAMTVPGRYTSAAELDPHGADKTMRTMIAYSAVDEGANSITARPFGDTGIKALYDDANNLGMITTGQADVSWGIRNHAVNISKAFVQFAGELALNKVLQSAIPAAVNG